MPKQKKDYKHIAMIERKFARIIKTISFIVRYDHCDAMLQVNYPSAKANGLLVSTTSLPTISTSVNSDSPYRTTYNYTDSLNILNPSLSILIAALISLS